MIIVEGIDGVGKTTLVKLLKEKYGFKDVSYKYTSADGFAKKYFHIYLDTVDNGISDRSFISEVAKGDIVRGLCRLSNKDYEKLLDYYSSFGTIIIYLKADKSTLLERRKDDLADFEMISNLYDDIDAKYDEVMQIARQYIPVYEFDTTSTTVEEIIQYLHEAKVLNFSKKKDSI